MPNPRKARRHDFIIFNNVIAHSAQVRMISDLPYLIFPLQARGLEGLTYILIIKIIRRCLDRAKRGGMTLLFLPRLLKQAQGMTGKGSGSSA